MSHIVTVLAKKKIIVQDGFNRTDGALGNANTGQAWQTSAGTFTISGQRATNTTAADADFTYLDAGISNALISSKLQGVSVSRAGILFRGIDANNFLLAFVHSDGNLKVYRRLAGSFTLLVQTPSPVANTALHVMSVVCMGSSINVYINASLVISTTITDHVTGSKCGLFSSGAGSAVFWDDFKAEVL